MKYLSKIQKVSYYYFLLSLCMVQGQGLKYNLFPPTPVLNDIYITDVIHIRSHGDKQCQYYQMKQTNDITTEVTNEKYVTSVYIKQNENIEQGKKVFQDIQTKIQCQRNLPIQVRHSP